MSVQKQQLLHRSRKKDGEELAALARYLQPHRFWRIARLLFGDRIR